MTQVQDATPTTVTVTPTTLAVPLASGDVAPPALLVSRGDRVTRGQRLCDPVGESSHTILSPVNGRIGSVDHATIAGGVTVPVVHIDVDTSAHAPSTQPPPRPTDLAALFNQLRDAGVQADRQNSPDVLAQIHQAIRRPCDTIICHGLDGDPRATLNADVLASSSCDVATAVDTLARLTSAQRALLVMSHSGPDLPDETARALRASSVRVLRVENRYPLGDPTLMIYTLLKRRLRPGRLPTELGVLLIDAPAAAAIGRWLRMGEPMLDVPVAVHDARTHRVWRGRAPIGTSVADTLRAAGVGPELVVRCGDALRDVRSDLAAVIGGGELLLHVGYTDPSTNPDACIRCGWCIQACPTRIHPAGLLEAAQTHDTAMAERFGLDACIECGICSYVCPSRLPLLGSIRAMRARGMR